MTLNIQNELRYLQKGEAAIEKRSIVLRASVVIDRAVNDDDPRTVIPNGSCIVDLNTFPEETSTSDEPLLTAKSKPITDVRIVSIFTVRDDLVAAVGNERVWLAKSMKNDVTLSTLDGHIEQTIKTDFTVSDLAVTKSNELLTITYNGNKVKKMDKDGIFRDLYVAQIGHITEGITVTDNNDIVVCLFDSCNEEGKLAKLTEDGTLVKIIQFDRDGVTPLFYDPCRVSSNRNGDLLVTQPGNDVIGIDDSGHLRFTYAGQVKSLKKRFSPMYTVTDNCGYILISDFFNSAIHLLDKDGNFVQIIQTDNPQVKRPKGLTIDHCGRLWVCSSQSKTIIVMKYKYLD